MSQKILHTVAIYPGRFHGFHAGHLESFKQLQNKFGKENTYIGLSDKHEPGSDKWPFSAEDRKQLLIAMGVNEDKIIVAKNPNVKTEYLKQLGLPEESTLVVVGVSEKDMDEDPRFKFGKTKAGKETHFQPYSDSIEDDDEHPVKDHTFIFTTKTVAFDGMTGASEIRSKYKEAISDEDRLKILKKIGYADKAAEKVKPIFDKNLLKGEEVKEQLRKMVRCIINEDYVQAELHIKRYISTKLLA